MEDILTGVLRIGVCVEMVAVESVSWCEVMMALRIVRGRCWSVALRLTSASMWFEGHSKLMVGGGSTSLYTP